MISVNLIPMRHRQQRLLRARRKRWVVAASIYAILLAVAYGGWRIAWGGDDLDMSHQLTLLRSDLADGAKSISRIRAALHEAKLTRQANQAVTGQPDWSLLLALIARMRGDEVVLNRCALDISSKTLGLPAISLPALAESADAAAPAVLRLQGYGRTQASVAQFALGLERTGLFETVSLLKTNREMFLNGEAVAFRMECQLKAAGDASPPKPKPAAKTARGGVVTDVSDAGGNAP